MPGMLSETQNMPPSSAPGSQTPPAGNPGAGNSPPGSAPGAGQPPAPGQPPQEQSTASFEQLRDQGIQRLYGDNFDSMIEMFQTNGAENFPKSMGIAVNSTLQYLEQENGQLPVEMAAEVGMDVMMKLLEDIIGGGVVPDVKLEQVQQAFPAILVMYADAHPEVSKQDIQELVQEVGRGVAAHQGGDQAPDGNQSVPPETPPGAPPQAPPQAPPGAV